MSRDEWDALVRQARATDLRKLLDHYNVQLDPSWKRTRSEFVGPCPVCGTGDDRFSVNFAKEVFFCRVCDKGGKGPIDLEMFIAGVDFVAAVKALTGVTSLSRLRTPDAESEAKAKQRQRDQAAAEQTQHATAAKLWKNSKPAAGSIVSTYLKRRGYSGIIPPTIRYLPARDDYAPAMISAYAEPVEGEPGELVRPKGVRAVHLTRLRPDGSDRERGKGAKITIGRPLGKPIAISSITDGLSLAICEGIEDALALAAAGFAAWAAGSAPIMPALAASIPDCITTVIIEQHPDEGAQYAAKLAKLLRAREVRKDGRAIEIIMRKATS
jgi:CHC2 zinc finger